jgi:MFS family permease
MNEITASPAATRKAGPVQAWVLIFAMFLPIMAIVALAPALPTLVDHFKGVPNAAVFVPMLLTAPALCIAIFGALAGYLSDRFGRRRLFLGAMVLYLIGGSTPFFLASFSQVLAGRVLLGIAEAFVLAIGNALLADYFLPADRNKWLMIQGIVGPFLATSLLVISGQLAAKGWQWPFLAYSATIPILVFAYFFVFEPERKNQQIKFSRGASFPYGIAAILCSVTLFTSILYFVESIQFSLVLREIGVNDQALIGRISAVASIAVPFGAYLFRYSVRMAIPLQLGLIFALTGVGLVGIGLLRDYHLTVVAALVQQLAAGMTVSTLVAWALSRLPAEHRGGGMGLWAAAFFIGQFASPLAVSALRGVTGGLLPAVTACGGVCLLAAFVSFLMNRLGERWESSEV